MINKKIILGLFVFTFIASCGSPTAMIGPAYSLTSSGSVLQAGVSYGTNELITAHTGKTPIENFQEISSFNVNKNQNIQKKTLESEEFYFLVKNKIEITRDLFKKTNQ